MRHISLIVAYDRKRGIGKDNKMPWHLPGELAHFKRMTMGKPIVMGRKTHESIGRALPGRRNIVITSRGIAIPGVETASTLQGALSACSDAEETMVTGGGQIYAAALPLATRIYATEIDADFEADTRFPAIDPTQWREVRRDRHPADDKTPYPLDFVVYERTSPPPSPA
jgi:dihydrofolate reductase